MAGRGRASRWVAVVVPAVASALVGPRESGVATRLGAVRTVWQEELLRSPKVAVRESSIEGAGEGVFATSDASEGETLTFIEYTLSEKEATSVNTYTSSYFAWHEQYGAYELADRRRRSPLEDGVGHLVNDAARLEPIEWTAEGRVASGKSSVEAYVYASERGANIRAVDVQGETTTIAGQERSTLQRVVATRDIKAGEELFRTYGAHFWLRPAEYALHYLMDFARIDLRLTACSLFEHYDLLFARSREIFDDCKTRLETIDAEYDALRRELDLAPFARRHPYVDYEGYEVWCWANNIAYDVRVDLATRLNVYDTPFLPADIAQLAAENLRQLHYLDGPEIASQIRIYLNPPFNARHEDRHLEGMFAQRRDVRDFGKTPNFPW